MIFIVERKFSSFKLLVLPNAQERKEYYDMRKKFKELKLNKLR